jgi:Rps23 Pro-64 3,4-dihydroxylase Tpa1-like proline 4-hydroxylase
LSQTGDLANIDAVGYEDREKLQALTRLRDELYSPTFRAAIESLTGCDTLNARVDCAANVYGRSCQLLCHDDSISTRRISYILYVSDGDEHSWRQADGGVLELYPQSSPGLAASTHPVPTKCIAPNFGTLVVFTVVGGTSMHSVQEVFCADKRRISIQGWFHSDKAPLRPEGATIAQLTSAVTQAPQRFPLLSEGLSNMQGVWCH